MADISLTGILPSGSSVVSGISKGAGIITWIIIIVVLIAICVVIAIILLRLMKYRYKIIIFEKIGSRWEQSGKDKGMTLKYGLMGDPVLYLRKRKKYLPFPELQTGRKTYWWAIREDGEWVNIQLEDIDMAMKEAKAKFLHPEMRYARTALIRNIKERYDKPNFMEKYGMIIFNIAGFIILGLLMYFVADKLLGMMNTNSAMMVSTTEGVNKVLDKANTIMASLDRICSSNGARAA